MSCSPPPDYPPPERCSPDHVKVTVYAPKGVFGRAYFRQCKEIVGSATIPEGYYLWDCDAIKGTERDSVSFEAQRNTKVWLEVNADPQYIISIDINGETIPVNEKSAEVEFTVTGDTVVRVNTGCPPIESTWPEEWLGDWSKVSISPITEAKPIMEDILGRPLTSDEKRELECCTWWGGERILELCQGSRPSNLPYIIDNPGDYIKELSIKSHLPDWKKTTFISYCDRPLIILSAESPNISKGTKMRIVFPLLAVFIYDWIELYWASLDFKYGEKVEDVADPITETVVSVETFGATRLVKVKVNVKEAGYSPTTVTAMIDDTEIGSITVDAPGEYEFDAVEVEPGVYTVKAVAVDSIGQRGEASKRVEVS